MGAGDAKYFTLYRDISVPWMFLLAHKLMKMKMKLYPLTSFVAA